MRVSVSILKGNGGAWSMCTAMAKGIDASGDTAVVRDVMDYNMTGFDALVLWGFKIECQRLIGECRAAGKPWVFIDNGYQLRSTHFKVALNDRHPDAYLMKMNCPSTRFNKWGVTIKPYCEDSNFGEPIIVAGMSPKAAWSFEFAFEEYETDIIAKLRAVTKRPIIYRPKVSNSPNAKPIAGSELKGKDPVGTALVGAHCVVAHHSNVGCDAVLAGVPVFTRLGAARSMGWGDDQLDRLESPLTPPLHFREQWAYNLAYCQWSAPEMASGECWKYIKGLMSQHGK